MKKVLNWTIGSFFRTIGRTIAFIVMGGLIYYLLSYNGIGIKDLFFERVSAMSLDGNYDRQININSTRQRVNLDEDNEEEFINFGTTFTANGSKYGVITFSGLTFSISEQNPDATYTYMMSLAQTYIQVYIMSNGAWQSCELQNNLIVCSLSENATYSGLWFRVSPSTKWSYHDWYVELELNNYISLYSTDTQAIIDSQNQNTQDIIEQQQNSTEQMLDSNTTEAEEEATSFFEDFDVPDVGGLSAIITAPLNTIRSLLNSSCTNLTLPLPYVNKNIVLPCMNSIYTEHFGAFFSIYQTIILAIIAYRCIRSIYFDIHGFTNPNDDRIEVMDL